MIYHRSQRPKLALSFALWHRKTGGTSLQQWFRARGLLKPTPYSSYFDMGKQITPALWKQLNATLRMGRQRVHASVTASSALNSSSSRAPTAAFNATAAPRASVHAPAVYSMETPLEALMRSFPKPLMHETCLLAVVRHPLDWFASAWTHSERSLYHARVHHVEMGAFGGVPRAAVAAEGLFRFDNIQSRSAAFSGIQDHTFKRLFFVRLDDLSAFIGAFEEAFGLARPTRQTTINTTSATVGNSGSATGHHEHETVHGLPHANHQSHWTTPGFATHGNANASLALGENATRWVHAHYAVDMALWNALAPLLRGEGERERSQNRSKAVRVLSIQV